MSHSKKSPLRAHPSFPAPFVPKSAPEALHPLFTTPEPGDLVKYRWHNEMFQHIRAFHGSMPQVKRYEKLLRDLLGDNAEAFEREEAFGPAKVANAKTAMVTAVLDYYGCHVYLGARWLREELVKARTELKEWEDVSAEPCEDIRRICQESERATNEALAQLGSA